MQEWLVRGLTGWTSCSPVRTLKRARNATVLCNTLLVLQFLFYIIQLPTSTVDCWEISRLSGCPTSCANLTVVVFLFLLVLFQASSNCLLGKQKPSRACGSQDRGRADVELMCGFLLQHPTLMWDHSQSVVPHLILTWMFLWPCDIVVHLWFCFLLNWLAYLSFLSRDERHVPSKESNSCLLDWVLCVPSCWLNLVSPAYKDCDSNQIDSRTFLQAEESICQDHGGRWV